MWNAEQGNVLKAKDDLEKVRLICGTDCRAYKMRKDAIDGNNATSSAGNGMFVLCQEPTLGLYRRVSRSCTRPLPTQLIASRDFEGGRA